MKAEERTVHTCPGKETGRAKKVRGILNDKRESETHKMTLRSWSSPLVKSVAQAKLAVCICPNCQHKFNVVNFSILTSLARV
jgi:hypothetical protein